MDARRALDAARLRVALEFPYLATGVWALRGPILVPGLMHQAGGAIAVDKGWRLYLDPELEWPVGQLATALRHEVWHCLRGHCTRIGSRCRHRWGIAIDLEINSDMQVERPEPDWPYEGLHPEQFNLPEHLLAEEYFELLPRRDQPQHRSAPGTTGSAPTSTPREADDDDADEDSEPCGGAGDQESTAPSQAGSTSGSGGITPGCAGCGMCDGSLGAGAGRVVIVGGSASDGVPRVWEQGTDGKVKELTGTEADSIRRQVAQQIRESSQNRGNLPAGITRWADSRLEPAKVPWQQVLRGAVRHAVAHAAGIVDYTRSKLSRRQAVSGSKVLLPAFWRPRPKVAIVIDTSGSMSDEQLRMALCEVQGVITGSGSEEVAVLTCDATPYDPQNVRKARDVELQGGGGTDMPAGLEACKKLRPRPQVVAVLTDGYTNWSTDEPPFKTVVCLLGQHADPSTVPSWATVVEVNE
jgi:predicted metal-dependent peptidase